MFTGFITNILLLSIEQIDLRRELATNLRDNLEEYPSTYYEDARRLSPALGAGPSYYDEDTILNDGINLPNYQNSSSSYSSSDSGSVFGSSSGGYKNGRNLRAVRATTGRNYADTGSSGLDGGEGGDISGNASPYDLAGAAVGSSGGGRDIGFEGYTRGSYQDIDNIERSKDMMSVVNSGLPEEKVEDAIIKNRNESTDIINNAAVLGSKDYYANNRNGSPSGALYAAAEAAGSAEVMQQKKDQALKKPLLAIQATKRVEEVGRRASAEYASAHPGALNSEILRAGAKAAHEEERRLDVILKAEKISDAASQQRYSQLKEKGLTHSEASLEADQEKAQTQREIESQLFNSINDEYNTSSMIEHGMPIDESNYQRIMEQREFESEYLHPTNSQLGIMMPEEAEQRMSEISTFDNQMIPPPNALEKQDYSRLKKEREDLLQGLQEAINLKDSRDKDERASYNQAKDALQSEAQSEEFLKSVMDDTFSDDYKEMYEDLTSRGGVSNSDILNGVVDSLSEVDNFAKAIVVQDVGGKLGLTKEMKNKLDERGYSNEEITAINTAYVKDLMKNNEKLAESYSDYATSGNLRSDLMTEREESLASIGKDSSLENLESRIQSLLKEEEYYNVINTSELSPESKAYGDYVGGLIYEETHDLKKAHAAAQKAALNREKAVDAINTVIDSKKASADILRANSVIDEAKQYVTAIDKQKIEELERAKSREGALESAGEAVEEMKIVKKIEEEVKNLQKDQALHSLEAEKHVITSNIKARKAQIMEDNSRRVDVLGTTEALENNGDSRLQNLGIKKVVDDDQSFITLTDASLNLPLKVAHDIEAKDETEEALLDAQNKLVEDLRNKVTDKQFDTRLSVIEGNDGNFNVGENAKNLVIKEGLVIFPQDAKQKMDEEGLNTSQLVEHVNQGEYTKVAAGIVYYSAPISNMKMEIPTPSQQVLSQSLIGEDGSIIDTKHADQLYIDEGRLEMTPWSEFSQNIRPTMNRPMEREDVFTEEEKKKLDEIKQITEDFQDTITQAFVNPDGNRIIKLIPAFGPSMTVTEEKANAMTQIDQQLGAANSNEELNSIINMEEYEDALTENVRRKSGSTEKGSSSVSSKNAFTSKSGKKFGKNKTDQKYKSEKERAQAAQSSSQKQSGSQSSSNQSSSNSSGSSSSNTSGSSSSSMSGSSSSSSSGSSSSSMSGGGSNSVSSIQTNGGSATVKYSGLGPSIDSFMGSENKQSPDHPNPLNALFKEESKIAEEIIENPEKYITDSGATFNADKLKNLVKDLPVEILKEYNQLSKRPYKDKNLMDPSKAPKSPNSNDSLLLHKQSKDYIKNRTGNSAIADKVDEIIFKAIKNVYKRPNPTNLKLAEVKDIKVEAPSAGTNSMAKVLVSNKPNSGPVTPEEIKQIVDSARNAPKNSNIPQPKIFINNKYNGPMKNYVQGKINRAKEKKDNAENKPKKITFRPDIIYVNPAPRQPSSVV